MIRFLIAILAVTVCYLGLITISRYDTTISFLLFNYKIDMSFFLVIVISIMLISLSFLFLRAIGFIFQTPYLIAAKFAEHKKNNYNKHLLDAYVNVVMGNTELAQRAISRLKDNKEDKDSIEHVHLITALLNQDFDKHMHLLQNLLSNQQYHNFAAKKLAKKLYDQGFYAQSLGYAEQIRDPSSDPEALLLLMALYANVNKWEKFTAFADRYSGIFPDKAALVKGKIADYYVKGAKYFLSQGEPKKSVVYLEAALGYDPMNMEAIETLCEINVSLGKGSNNLSVIEAAFTVAPSFELFELYHKSSSLKPVDLYNRLASLVDIDAYRDVFLAIAAYLKLSDKIDYLLSAEI